MKVETTNYREAHGQLPNGHEPGAWSFDLFRDHACTTITTPTPMKLAAAKQWAIREARQIGGIEVIQVAS